MKGSEAFTANPSKEYGKLMFKKLDLLDDFQGKIFKDRVREKVVGSLTS